jgi:hypothetical protein
MVRHPPPGPANHGYALRAHPHPPAGGRGGGQRAAGAGTARRVKSAKSMGVWSGQLAHPPAAPGAPERAGHHDHQAARPRHHRAVLPGCGVATPVRGGGTHLWALFGLKTPGGAVPAAATSNVKPSARSRTRQSAFGRGAHPVSGHPRGAAGGGARAAHTPRYPHVRSFAGLSSSAEHAGDVMGCHDGEVKMLQVI